MSIEIGWWLVPLFITFTAFSIAKAKSPEPQVSGYIPDMWSPMLGLGFKLIAAVVSLTSWLVWALLR